MSDVETYLKKHGISEIFENLTAKIVEEKPENVYGFLIQNLEEIAQKKKIQKRKIIFVLGGPGSGKGTQCTKLVETGKFVHFSAGDLLRKATKQGDERGQMIANHIKNGTIVPGYVTIGLLREAIEGSDKDKTVLIDGFPREIKQGLDFERDVGPCSFVLTFSCSEETLEKRLLERGKSSNRTDDNKKTIIRRFRTFKKQTMPVIQYFSSLDKVKEISGENPIDKVFEEVKKAFDL